MIRVFSKTNGLRPILMQIWPTSHRTGKYTLQRYNIESQKTGNSLRTGVALTTGNAYRLLLLGDVEW
jgi:hypothetical protein